MKRTKLQALSIAMIFTLVLTVLALTAACVGPTPSPSPTPTPSPSPAAWNWPKTLNVAVSGVGSNTYDIMAGWGAAFERATGTKVRVVPTEVMPELTKWPKMGLVDFSVPPMTECKGAVEGLAAAATKDGGPYQVRIVLGSAVSYFGWMVRGDSDIKTLYDLDPKVGGKVRTYGLNVGAPTVRATLDAILDMLHLEEGKDIKVVSFPGLADEAAAIMDGRIDICSILNMASFIVEAESKPQGIRWIDFPTNDSKAMTALFARRPEFIPAKMSTGVKSSIGHTGNLATAAIICTADTDTELVYRLVKWTNENINAFKGVHPQAGDLAMDTFLTYISMLYIPLHEGTIRYVKELGKWNADLDALQKNNVDLITKYVQAYKAALAEADKQGIKVDPYNDKWVSLWASFKQGLPVLKANIK